MSAPQRLRLAVCFALTSWAATVALAAVPTDSSSPPYTLRGQWQQGRLIFGRAKPGVQLTFNGRALQLSPQGDFVFGLDRDAPPGAELGVAEPGQAESLRRYLVQPRAWDVQRIDGLPPEQVNPPPEAEARIEREQALIAAAHAIDSAGLDFLQPLHWPLHGRVSGVFGSQRILNGVPKSPHYGVDVAVPIGTPVYAPAGGVISLAEPDLYFTGGTLIIDHGHGVSSILVHLSKLRVKLGERVVAGALVADSGMTGRATGPHLHWGVYWFDRHVDPQTLVGPMTAALPRRQKR